MTQELQTILKDNEIEDRKDIQEAFAPLFNQAKDWAEKANAIVVNSAEDVEGMQQAREARLALKGIRVEAEKVKKAKKAAALREGNAIQGMFNIIKFLIEPIEEALEEKEKFAERAEEKRRFQLKAKREAELLTHGVDITFLKVEEMSDEVYEQFLKSAKAELKAKEAAEKKAEDERIKKEKEKDAEDERMRKENALLKKEQEERDEVEKKKEFKRQAELAKERKATEEKYKKEREAHHAKLEKERKEREKVEAELKAKKDAELKVEEEKKRKEKEKADADYAALIAPDKDKLLKLVKDLQSIQLPILQDKNAIKVGKGVQTMLGKMVFYINDNTEKL